MSGNAPATVSVHVQGFLPDSCSTLGSITQQRSGEQVYVSINMNHASTQPNGQTCAQVVSSFDTTFNLNGRFDAGDYTVQVNGIGASFNVGGWAGDWNCTIDGGPSCGRMRIALDHNAVSGSFGNGGSIDGTVSGNTLTGTWSYNGGNGSFSTTLAPDGQSFVGTWQPGNQLWCGWRDGASKPFVCDS